MVDILSKIIALFKKKVAEITKPQYRFVKEVDLAYSRPFYLTEEKKDGCWMYVTSSMSQEYGKAKKFYDVVTAGVPASTKEVLEETN